MLRCAPSSLTPIPSHPYCSDVNLLPTGRGGFLLAASLFGLVIGNTGTSTYANPLIPHHVLRGIM